MSNQVHHHLRTEELYKKIMHMVADDEEVTEQQVQALLDAILSQGKIEGRLSAFSDPLEPKSGHLWYRREEPDDVVEIESVSRDHHLTVHIFYRHTNPQACVCGRPNDGIHARRGHASREVLAHFTAEHALKQAPADRLIEDWQRIVDSV